MGSQCALKNICYISTIQCDQIGLKYLGNLLGFLKNPHF